VFERGREQLAEFGVPIITLAKVDLDQDTLIVF
jgi:hypothetical protein